MKMNRVFLKLSGEALAGPKKTGFDEDTVKEVARQVKLSIDMYTELASEHPIDLCRYQVANGYMGRVGLINSGGESHGESDLRDAVITAVVNKRAGGMGLISGRKAFQKPMNEGVELLNTIQDVYLDSSITIA